MNIFLSDEQKIAIVDELGAKLSEVIPPLVLAKVLGLYTVADVARRLGLTWAGLRHHLGVAVPRPTHRIGRRSYYTAEEVAGIVRWWQAECSRPHVNWSVEQVAEMRRMYQAGYTQWDIADEFGIDQSTVSRLIRGKRNSRTAP